MTPSDSIDAVECLGDATQVKPDIPYSAICGLCFHLWGRGRHYQYDSRNEVYCALPYTDNVESIYYQPLDQQPQMSLPFTEEWVR